MGIAKLGTRCSLVRLGIAQLGTRCSLVRDGNSSVRDELLLSFTFGSDFAEILEFF